MIIYRDGQAIELTDTECYQAYKETRNEVYIDHIGDKLREDYDIEPCTDDSKIDLEEIADNLHYIILDNNIYDDIYWNSVYIAIEEYLKEKGLKQ